MTVPTVLQMVEADLFYYRKQLIMCKDGIENGNWDGYSENLKVRKENLKFIQEMVDILELKLEELKNEK